MMGAMDAESDRTEITVVPASPAIATRETAWGDYPLIKLSSGDLAGPDKPLPAGDTVTLTLTGLGRKSPVPDETLAVPSQVVETVTVTVNGQPAEVTFAGTSAVPGVDQLTWITPGSIIPNDLGLVVVTISAADAQVSFQINAIVAASSGRKR